jgi:hypothetical protein
MPGQWGLQLLANDNTLPEAGTPNHDSYLPAIIGCKKNETDQAPAICENQDDPTKESLSNGKMGKTSGGCFYVTRGKVNINGTFLKATYNKVTKKVEVPFHGFTGLDEEPTPKLLDSDGSYAYEYSGWVIASSVRKLIYSGTGANAKPILTYGTGYPCEQVLINKEALDEVIALAPTASAAAPIGGDFGSDTTGDIEAGLIKECIVEVRGGSVANSATSWQSAAKVKHVGTKGQANTSFDAPYPAYSRNYCNNGALNLSDTNTFTQAIAYDTVNTEAGIDLAGLCVYVKAKKVLGYFPTTLYTGWFRLGAAGYKNSTAANPWGFSGADGSLVSPKATLNGIPCTGGVVSYPDEPPP